MHVTFTDVDIAGLLRIAGEVSELGPDLRLRRGHLLDRLLGLLGGFTASCSEIDPAHVHGSGWALPDTVISAGPLSSDQQRFIDRYLTGQLSALDPCIPILLQEQKPVVTARREDVIGQSWFRSDHFNEIRRPLGFGESLYAVWTTPDGRRLKLSMHRAMNDSPFTERDARLLHVFHENLAGLYVSAQPVSTSPEHVQQPDPRIESLPRRLRPVLRRLLAGDAEKQAALKLGLSPHTVHEYTKVLYRTFGVNSCAELLAQFVGE